MFSSLKCEEKNSVLKKTTLSTISTGRLNTLLCVHRPPINLMVYKGCHPSCEGTISNLGGGFPLRCFQRLSVGNLVTQRCIAFYATQLAHQGFPHPSPLVILFSQISLRIRLYLYPSSGYWHII